MAYVGSTPNWLGAIQIWNSLNGDAFPVVVNPQLSCSTYVIAPTSPVYGAPVSFTALQNTWGPPGYTVPTPSVPTRQSSVSMRPET